MTGTVMTSSRVRKQVRTSDGGDIGPDRKRGSKRLREKRDMGMVEGYA